MQNQISLQKGNLKEFIEKIQSLEEAKSKVDELFSCSQQKLEDTTLRLNYTKQVVAEKSILVEKQKETEDELYSSGTDLLDTVSETVVDNKYLHQSLDRKRNVQEKNVDICQTFKEDAKNKLCCLSNGLLERSKILSCFQESMKLELGKLRTNCYVNNGQHQILFSGII